MFIELTRHSGGRTLRVAIGAIAYLDALDDGTSLHLTGGQSIRVDEQVADIEERCAPAFVSAELVSAPMCRFELPMPCDSVAVAKPSAGKRK